LKWEEKTEINIGADFETLSNRLRGSVEYYNSVTSDLLFEVGVPVPPNLFGTTWRNVGELENSGLELSLALDAVQSTTGGLNWSTQFNFTAFGETMLNKFETDEVRYIATAGSPGQNSTDLIRIKEGEPIGQIWGPEFSRIGPDGNWLFLDGDGNEVPFGDLNQDDEKLLGNGLPDYQIGWTNSFNYGNWDMNIFLQGTFAHQLVNLIGLFYQAPRQIASYNILQSAMDVSELTDSPQYSSFYVEDADYIRLQNMSLGYTFNTSSVNQIDRLRLYVSANNLFTITGYKGINPEVRHTDENPGILTTGFTTGGALAPGIERRSNWFTTRSINLGINLSF
jgi:iron complex outermembrane receptor protein